MAKRKTSFVGSNVPDREKPLTAYVRHVEGWGEVKVMVQNGTVWLLRPDNVWDVMLPFYMSDGTKFMQVES